MFDPNEQELKDLNYGRLLRSEAELLLPMLSAQREQAVQRLIGVYRAGETDNKLALAVADISAIENIISEIKNKINKAKRIEDKIYGNPTHSAR